MNETSVVAEVGDLGAQVLPLFWEGGYDFWQGLPDPAAGKGKFYLPGK